MDYSSDSASISSRCTNPRALATCAVRQLLPLNS